LLSDKVLPFQTITLPSHIVHICFHVRGETHVRTSWAAEEAVEVAAAN
jgi:hypothetical protein